MPQSFLNSFATSYAEGRKEQLANQAAQANASLAKQLQLMQLGSQLNQQAASLESEAEKLKVGNPNLARQKALEAATIRKQAQGLSAQPIQATSSGGNLLDILGQHLGGGLNAFKQVNTLDNQLNQQVPQAPLAQLDISPSQKAKATLRGFLFPNRTQVISGNIPQPSAPNSGIATVANLSQQPGASPGIQDEYTQQELANQELRTQFNERVKHFPTRYTSEIELAKKKLESDPGAIGDVIKELPKVPNTPDQIVQELKDLTDFEGDITQLSKLYKPGLVGSGKFSASNTNFLGVKSDKPGSIDEGLKFKSLKEQGKFGPLEFLAEKTYGIKPPSGEEVAYKDQYEQTVQSLARVLTKGDRAQQEKTLENARQWLASPNQGDEYYKKAFASDLKDALSLIDSRKKAFGYDYDISQFNNLGDQVKGVNLDISTKEGFTKTYQGMVSQGMDKGEALKNTIALAQKSEPSTTGQNVVGAGGALAGAYKGFKAGAGVGSAIGNAIPNPLAKVAIPVLGGVIGAAGGTFLGGTTGAGIGSLYDNGQNIINRIKDYAQQLIQDGMSPQEAGKEALSEGLKQHQKMTALKSQVQGKGKITARVNEQGQKEITIPSGDMLNSVGGQDFIKNQEGYRDTAYMDESGVPTIGYGSTHINGKSVQPGMKITREQAERQYKQDVGAANSLIDGSIQVPLTKFQREALKSFIYNAGAGAFQRNQIAELINNGQTAEAARRMHQFIYVGKTQKKVSQGLINRRNKEQDMLLTEAQ